MQALIDKRSRTQHTQERRLYCTSTCPASDRRLGPEYGRVRETVDLDDLSQKSRIETEKKTTKCCRWGETWNQSIRAIEDTILFPNCAEKYVFIMILYAYVYVSYSVLFKFDHKVPLFHKKIKIKKTKNSLFSSFYLRIYL